MGRRRRWALAARCPHEMASRAGPGARKTTPTSAGISDRATDRLNWRLRTGTGWAKAAQTPSATTTHSSGRSRPAGFRPCNWVT